MAASTGIQRPVRMMIIADRFASIAGLMCVILIISKQFNAAVGPHADLTHGFRMMFLTKSSQLSLKLSLRAWSISPVSGRIHPKT